MKSYRMAANVAVLSALPALTTDDAPCETQHVTQ